MKIHSTILLTMVVVILAACQNQIATQTSETFQVNPSQITPLSTNNPPASPSGKNAPVGCTVVSPRPTPGPTEQSLFPPISEKDWVEGPDSAYVTILEYSDFQ